SISSFHEEVFVTEYRQFMVGLFGLGEPGMWIGYNDQKKEQDWKWSDPYIQSTFDNWAPRSPKRHNPKNKFDCVYQLVTNSGASKWKDKDCMAQHPFMCKMGAL
ncbi:lectin-like protein, partial [Salmonella sp. s51944]|uniref:lectin-like protein n=1 Tax=Salmonella sp. s51944 TaxID=3159655 RepID=UPI00397FF3BC